MNRQRFLSSRRRGGILAGLTVLLLIAAVGGFSYYWYFGEDSGPRMTNLIVQPVSRGPFDHIVLEDGEIESSRNTEIICNVKSRSASGGGGTAILWVVDEGTRVKKGDKLVELDSSQLETEMKQQRIIVGNAEAAVASAEALVEQANISRQEYLEGVFMTEERAILSEMAVAEQTLRKAQLAQSSAQRLVAKGLINSLQLEADQYAVANARNQLEAAEGRLRVLRELTRQKMLVQYDSDIAAARATLEAARSTLNEEQDKMKELQEQLAACVMVAPSEGVVVHANQYSSRGGSEFVVEPGAVVRERQVIIRLPDPSLMQVKTKINESRVTLVREGMPARIRVGSLEGMELLGRVTKVNRYAEPSSFFSSSVKEYACLVQIVDPPETIRTGMTAEVRIYVEQLPDALQVPIQGVYEHGGQTYTLVREAATGKLETRAVDLGATNDTMATIEDGLDEGEQVVLNLRDNLHLMDLPEVTPENRDEMVALRTEGAGPDGPGASGPGDAGPADGAPAEAGRGGGGAAGMVGRAFENDADGDGALSQSELQAIPEGFRNRIAGADSDGDGAVTRDEMTRAAARMIAAGGGRRGGGPGGRGPGGGGPGGGGPGGGGPGGPGGGPRTNLTE